MENWKRNLWFLAYVLISTGAMITKFYTLYDTSPNFYVLGARFSNGDALLILTNMMIMLTLITGKLLQYIVFGELRLIEIEHLYERLWPTIIGLVVSANAYKARENSFFRIALFVGLLFSKVFHCIVIDRLDALIQQYYQPNGNSLLRMVFNRIVLTLAIFLQLDITIIKSCIDESFVHRSTILLVIAFEFFLLVMDLAYSAIKFSLNVFELYYIKRFPEEEVWSYKVWIDSIAKVLLGIVRCVMIPTLFTFFTLMDSIPLNLLNEIFRSFYSLTKSIASLYRLVKNAMKLNSSLGYPTAEELQDDDICIICRDDMVFGGTGTARSVPRKLPCGHILHDGCIRSWLEMSNACPTCRKNVIPSNSEETADAGAQNGDRAADAAEDQIQERIRNDAEANTNNEENPTRTVQNLEERVNDNGADGLNQSENNIDDNGGTDNGIGVGSSNETNDIINDENEGNGGNDIRSRFANRIHPANQISRLFGVRPSGVPSFRRRDNFEVVPTGEREVSDRQLHNDRLNQIGNVVDKIGSLKMNEQQRGRWKRVRENCDVARSNNNFTSGESQPQGLGGDSGEEEFVHEVPPNTTIPKDWTIFPAESMGNEEYEVGLSKKRRVTMKVVRNGRIIDRNTFGKYTRK